MALQVDDPLARVARLLGMLGIGSRVKVGRTSKSTRDTYWLTVAGADQVERLMELVKRADRAAVSASLARPAAISPSRTTAIRLAA